LDICICLKIIINTIFLLVNKYFLLWHIRDLRSLQLFKSHILLFFLYFLLETVLRFYCTLTLFLFASRSFQIYFQFCYSPVYTIFRYIYPIYFNLLFIVIGAYYVALSIRLFKQLFNSPNLKIFFIYFLFYRFNFFKNFFPNNFSSINVVACVTYA